jgi:hypothetical protein
VLSFAELRAERAAVLAELAALEAAAPNPRDGGDYIAERDAYYAKKAVLQQRAEDLTREMQAAR